jgi:hypothetical protein
MHPLNSIWNTTTLIPLLKCPLHPLSETTHVSKLLLKLVHIWHLWNALSIVIRQLVWTSLFSGNANGTWPSIKSPVALHMSSQFLFCLEVCKIRFCLVHHQKSK